MSGSDMSFQTQVASVLDALVKVAAVEITKLFETRYVASGTSTIRIEGTEQNETLEMLDGFRKLGKTCRRSIGVQVDEGTATSELPAPDQRFSSEGVSDCLMECRMEAGPTTDTPLVEVKEAADLTCTVLTEEVEMVEGSCLESESLPTRDPSTEQEICGLVDPNHLSGSAQSSTVDQEPQPPQTELKTDLNACSQAEVIISPMLPRAEEQDSAPEPECKEEPAQVELQQAMVSTTKGTADSPSSLDGAAVAPVQVSLCKPPSAVKEVMVNHNHQLKQNSLDLKLKQSPLNLKLNLSSMNLKLKQSPINLKLKLKQSPMNLKLKQSPMDLKLKHNSLDLKLLRPCSVQLVNLHLVPGSEGKKAGPGNGNQNVRQFPTPKDLRTHQHLHTGRRLCCFTQCGNGVWRLQGVLAHKQQQSRTYGCDICGKRFKRRKILRRHERFHTGEKPYSCTKCRKMFALRKSLRRHVRFHTGERPHRCPQCGKSFRVRDNLKTHLRFHTGERPFTCSSCSKSFRILRNLERHSVVHIGLEALHSK